MNPAKNAMQRLFLISCAFLCLALAGCETQPERQTVTDKMGAMIDEGVDNNARQEVPAEVTSALVPTINLGSSDLPDLKDEQHFDIAVNDVPAQQFFMSLVDGTRYNMVVHPEVGGTITLNLTNVTIPDVLEAVRDVYGYEFVATEYGFQVLPGRLQARIYQINYLNVERSGSSRTVVSSGSLTSGGDSGGGGLTGDFGSGTMSEESTSTFLGTEIRTQQPESMFWQELASSVTAIVGTGEGRSVVVNPQSGVVVVRALPNELREVEAYLEATQLIVQRQVILEAKILEVRLSDGFQSGINWSMLLTPGNDRVRVSNLGGGSILVDEAGTSDIAGDSSSLDPDEFPFAAPLASAFGGAFTVALALGDFSAFIELLETQGSVQVLSSPRVATLNNQKAVIKVGQDEFFVTDITSTVSSTTANTNVFPRIQLTPFFSGIALDVTPQISGEGLVTLHIHPSVSNVKDQQKTVTIGNLKQEIPLALSTIRESDSIVMARSGHVVVIGGLMQDTINNQDARTPVLGDVPLVGNLFKHRKEESVKTELVILLKPIVVDEGAKWSDELLKSRQSLERLREPAPEQN